MLLFWILRKKFILSRKHESWKTRKIPWLFFVLSPFHAFEIDLL
ncbi:hypothetical protein D1AOALGA4SA_3949 [Olavius algarvensis Delta 1 endosymbiont]|nr:hypothetical protein D1AOALGA4SA_3949 [Olavius algarvensis Delta 1 endosymbiont]